MRCYLCGRRIRLWQHYGILVGRRAWHTRCMALFGDVSRAAIRAARRESIRGLFPQASDAALDRAIAAMDSAREGLS